MKRFQILLILAVSLGSLSPAQVGRIGQEPATAQAQTSPAGDLSWWVVSGGGGRGASAGYALESAVGQPAAGPMASSSYGLAGGYMVHSDWWNFMPLVMKNHCSGGWETEPNNTDLVANGPLISGLDYCGYPNDQKDFFYFTTSTAGAITVDLTNYTGTGGQLQLFYQTVANRVGFAFAPPYRVTYTGAAGLYYVYIYTNGGFNTTTFYKLTVTFP